MAAPFVFWIDTGCVSTVTLQSSGSNINGQSSLEIGACGWAFVWADTNGTDWHAQAFQPPGGVTVIN
jgi:hypothetical protein